MYQIVSQAQGRQVMMDRVFQMGITFLLQAIDSQGKEIRSRKERERTQNCLEIWGSAESPGPYGGGK